MNQTSTEKIQTVLNTLKRVVIKIGTRVIDDEKTRFNLPIMTAIVRDIALLKEKGVEVLLVSSGAVGMGLRKLNIPKRPASIHLRQAYAAVGQNQLMNMYSDLLTPYGIIPAQILLTRSDLDRRESYLNAKEALTHLLTMGILPIINENDTVSIKELKFGDNDSLAALVAGKLDADLLILLTSVDGVFRSFDPKTKTGELIDVINEESDDVFSHIHQKVDAFSMGGMQSKIEAGKAACARGVVVAIANGLRPGIITDLLTGEAPASWMIPSKKRLPSWKYYLAFAKRPSGGKIVVDDGAVQALKSQGKSLLASGIKSIEGHFHEKELVRVFDIQGHEIARGLVNYPSEDLARIKGSSYDSALPRGERLKTVIHRNNLVLVE